MSKKLSTSEWIERARAKHGDRYDYSKTEYVDSKTNVEIGCKTHGSFLQHPADHLKPCGCPKCANEESSARRIRTTAWFISEVKKVHGDTYDYSQTKYTKAQEYCTVICKTHGPFTLKAYCHLQGQGCKECGIKRRIKLQSEKSGWVLSNEEMNKKALAIHGNKLKITSSFCESSMSMIDAVCEIHGPFSRSAKELFDDKKIKGCQQCGHERGWAARRADINEFIEKASKRHKNFYDYSLVSFDRVTDKVTIICPEHGPFEAWADQHMYGGNVCQSCASESRRKTQEQFLMDARKAHGDKYDYSLTQYELATKEVTIICREHGPFTVKPYRHTQGVGSCPRCGDGGTSYQEKRLGDRLALLGRMETRTRRVITPKEIDFYFPDSKIGIEFCGLYWHSEDRLPNSYHKDKLDLATSKGVRLIQIFEDEWLEKPELCLGILKRVLGVSKLTSVGARQCQAVPIGKTEAKTFLNTHHLSGYTGATEHYGLRYGDELVAVASFSNKRSFYGGSANPKQKELVRFCSHSNYVVHGALAKLTKYYTSVTPEIESVLSYVDRRWFTGQTYLSAGYEHIATTQPGYFYVKNQKRYSRFAFAKHRLENVLASYDSALTEHENMRNNGYIRLYDCGHYKFIWQK